MPSLVRQTQISDAVVVPTFESKLAVAPVVSVPDHASKLLGSSQNRRLGVRNSNSRLHQEQSSRNGANTCPGQTQTSCSRLSLPPDRFPNPPRICSTVKPCRNSKKAATIPPQITNGASSGTKLGLRSCMTPSSVVLSERSA